jgi:ABC-type Na+ efflux pump permease subunit
MSSIKAIVKKDLKDTFRSRAVYLSIGMAVFLFVMWSGDILEMAGGLAEKGVPASQVTTALRPVINSIAVMFSFMLTVFFGMYINGYAIILEKTKRSLESLLCTPVGLSGIWIGKTLAVFLPSAILGLGTTFLGLFGMNAAVIEPKLGAFVMPGGAPLLAALLGVPAVAFPLMLLVTGVQLLLKNIRWVNAVFLALIFGVGLGLSQSLKLDSGSWGLVGMLLGIAAGLSLLAGLLSRLLTSERIVLSSKG